MSRPYDAVNSL